MISVAFFSEFGAYIGVPVAEPGFTLGSPPGPVKRNVAPVQAAFGAVGWSPDGDVYYEYEAVTTGSYNGADWGGCPCPTCLTLTAFGDVDGKNGVGAVIYVSPDATGAVSCTSAIGGLAAPIDPATGLPVYNQVRAYPKTPGVADAY